ncbi:MAG: UbiA family prenyltransferase [candidate division WOR-3 bacterium]|nr:UbiA family prenyltransferase [candidate division WOR-3 bacterium]
MNKNIIERFIDRVESHSLGLAGFCVICWVFLRIFLEGIFESYHYIGFSPFSYKMLLTYFVHFPLFYFCLFLLLVIIISGLINEPVRNVTKTASIGLVIIVFVPLVDHFVGGGYAITYPLRLEPYLVNFLNPFVSLVDIGVSPGQRAAVFLISFLIGIYAFSKTRRPIRSIFMFLISLAVIILFGGLTTLLAVNHPESVYVPGGILYTDTQKYCALYMVLFSILAFVYLFLLNGKSARALLSTLRLERVSFYGGMAVFGFAVSLLQRGVVLEAGIFNYAGILTIFLSLAFGFWSLQVCNDLFDADIDRTVGKKNLVLSGITGEYYYSFLVFLFACALCCALIINFQAFLILLAYLVLGIVYSMPPVRLKRIPVVSTFVIAVAVCLCIGLGFSVYYGGRAFAGIPGRVLIPTLVGVTLGFIAKDIGHVEGDRSQGVITVPVLLYDRVRLPGRIPVAMLVSSSYLVYALFIPQSFPGALLCASITFLYTIAVKKTSEVFYFLMLYVFGGYLLYVLLSVLPF